MADVKAEGQFFHSENPHYVWRSGRMHKGADIVYRYWEGEQKDYGMEASLLWNPFCGRLLAPFIGLGVRYESASCEKHNSYKTFDYYYQEWHQGAWSPFRVYRDEDTSLDDSGVCLAARLGLKVNLGKMFLTGEYRVGSGFGDFDGTSELIGDIGFYLTRRMQMHVFVESVKVDLDSGTAFGGGLSFDF